MLGRETGKKEGVEGRNKGEEKRNDPYNSCGSRPLRKRETTDLGREGARGAILNLEPGESLSSCPCSQTGWIRLFILPGLRSFFYFLPLPDSLFAFLQPLYSGAASHVSR